MRLPSTHFLRRRKRAFLATFCGLLGAACALGLLLPLSYVARANLVSNGPGYDGSAELYAEQLNSEQALKGLVHPDLRVGLLGELLVMPNTPERLRPPRRPLIDVEQSGGYARVTIHVRGLTEAEALDAANALAKRMIRADQGDVGQLTSAALADADAGGDDPAMALAALRAAHPLLEDDAQLTRFEEEELEWERRREAERALEVQLQHEEARVTELQVAVTRQAQDAYTAHLAELQREREREAAARAAEQQQLEATQAERAAQEEPRVPLSELERELRQLLATRTRRHPEVRSLLRRIELERERLAPTPSWTDDPGPSQGGDPKQATPPADPPAAPDPAPSQPPESGPEEESASGEPISDELPDPPARARALPAVWLQRAPSYRELLTARERASTTRARLAAERARTERMRSRLDRQSAELASARAGLAEARAEELRLQRALSRREQRRAQQGARSPARLVASPAEIVERHEPFRFSLLAILASFALALLTAWAVDQRDPSVHEPDELESLDVPVLGVIPHIRRS